MKKTLFTLSLLLASQLSSKELILDDLLKEYEQSESLYTKTKKESAGFLIVYSREDLEKMQAYTLQDILKTIRLHTLQVRNNGAFSLTRVATGRMAMPPLKLYIDDYEVNSVLQSNTLDMYANLNLYFVDHIEIYQGGSSIAFGNEPGSMVIRLYSKDPSRENSTSFQFSVDSESSGDMSALTAGKTENFSYLASIDVAQVDYDTYERNNQTLSRDYRRYQTHLSLTKEKDFDFAIDAITTTTDILSGLGTAPKGNDILKTYGYIYGAKYFAKNWKAALSYGREKSKIDNEDVSPIGIGSTHSPYFYANIDSDIYKAILEYKIVNNKHDFLTGVQYQQKSFHLHQYDVQGYTPALDKDSVDIYMLYLEELYNLNKNNLLTFSGKVDYYQPEHFKDSTEYSLRLGFISLLSKEWSTKIFAIRRYVYPTMLQTSITPPIYKPNPNLESALIDLYAGEVQYKTGTNTVVLGYAYKEIENALSFNQIKKQYFNLPEQKHFNRWYIRAEHHFDLDNKIIMEYYKGYADTYFSPGSGVLIQSFNHYGKFNIYNELVYRSSYQTSTNFEVDAGYDYTLSLGYTYNKQTNIKLKGENLFDKASLTPIDPQGTLLIPATQRRVIATLEYTF